MKDLNERKRAWQSGYRNGKADKLLGIVSKFALFGTDDYSHGYRSGLEDGEYVIETEEDDGTA